MWAHTPLNLPWSSGHQVQLRTENRNVDAADSQTPALVASILESAVIQKMLGSEFAHATTQGYQSWYH